MREKELRFALVCFGGVSLAIYMHGVTKEILKLVRASRALHTIADVNSRAGRSFFDCVPEDKTEHDTEQVYFDLLRLANKNVDLRVIVDVIAGASAGGMNGIMLARALAHDLPFEGLRELWLSEADVTRLLARESIAKTYSKWFLTPLIWAFTKYRLPEVAADPEMRAKLSLFLRSRWFKPPFNGRRMTRLLFQSINGMGDAKKRTSSLLPIGHKLSLFVSLTDFYGYQQKLTLHDPPVITEREHRHILHFDYQSFADGDIHTDFDSGNAAALAFAARATSAFPGAFPPAQIGEMDTVLENIEATWPGRERFMRRNFARYLNSGMDPLKTSFIDGSVLNNKPFNEAIQSIKGRPAYRQVDRRLVYIDPDPARPPPPPSGHVPGFFRVLKGALSDIPRNEPISDELTWIHAHNERVGKVRNIIEMARPQIMRLVSDVAGGEMDHPFSVERIRAWREAANARAAREAGFAYEGYIRLKLQAVEAYIATSIAVLCGVGEHSLEARWITAAVEHWAALSNFRYDSDTRTGEDAIRTPGALPPWVRFLLRFDVNFRQRRLRFVIQAINQIYSRLDAPENAGVTPELLDDLKRNFYDALDTLRRHGRVDTFSPSLAMQVRAVFGRPVPPEHMTDVASYARDFAVTRKAELDALADQLAREIDLVNATDEVDAIIASVPDHGPGLIVRRELIIAYVGFSFWDVLTFSISNWRDLGEFDEIKVDRISPEDATAIRSGGARATLKGVNFLHFGAFFSRKHRENDYLWGRLHGVDRIIDIVCDAAGLTTDSDRAEALALKKRAFNLILDREEPHLTTGREIIAMIRAEVAAL